MYSGIISSMDTTGIPQVKDSLLQANRCDACRSPPLAAGSGGVTMTKEFDPSSVFLLLSYGGGAG